MMSQEQECGLVEYPGSGCLLRGVCVLVVDNYEPLRWLKSHLLKKNGAEVLEAATGIDALATVEWAKVDVALIDTGLPGMAAVELGDRIRATAAGIPVIFTAAASPETPLPANALLLGEPLNARKLAEVINGLLGRAASSAGC